MRSSIKLLLLIPQLIVVLLITALFSILLFKANVNSVESRIISNVQTIAKPLASLASRGVAGGNVMKLKNKDAQAIYRSSNALAIYISGMSDGSPATEYTAKIPPQKISYTYYANNPPLSQELMDQLKTQQQGFAIEHGVYVARQTFDIKNKGEFVAIFPAFEMQTVTHDTLKHVLPVSLFVLVVSIFVSYFIGKRLAAPINQMANDLYKIDSTLDLSVRFSDSSISEITKTSASLNHFIGHLQQLLTTLQSNQTEIAQSSQEVAAIAANSKTELDDQKTKLDTIVLSVTRMSDAINQVAVSTSQNAKEAELGSQLAQKGQQKVEKTVELAGSMEQSLKKTNDSLNQLNQATEEIGAVLSVIVGIAEQTNLLALNAAIEAARAGEQGRGFAVVADEVRTLAVKTQESTGEVSEIIRRLQSFAKQSVTEMESELVNIENTVAEIEGANYTLIEILQSMQAISSMTQQIAGSADEQSKVCEDINQNILGLSELYENALKNAAQTNSAVETVEKQLDGISKQITQFKLH